jgi:hypothetical protein
MTVRFLEGITDLRQSLAREVYPIRINQAQRLHKLGLSHISFSQWGVAMGPATTLLPFNRLFGDSKDEPKDESGLPKKIENSDDKAEVVEKEPSPRVRVLNAYASLNSGASLVMVWYPIITLCLTAGDKLSCIALRDTCRGLRNCYTMFRNDTSRCVTSRIPSAGG